MNTQPYHIENAQAGDFLAFEHDTGLKSFMIFRAIQPHYNPYTECYRFFAIVENNGNIHLQGECMYLEGTFRPCTAEEKIFLLRRLQKEGFIWEAGKKNLRKMNILERVFKFLNFNNFVWH